LPQIAQNSSAKNAGELKIGVSAPLDAPAADDFERKLVLQLRLNPSFPHPRDRVACSQGQQPRPEDWFFQRACRWRAATAATTGLRRSELAGLHWSDLDLINGWISVNRCVDNNLENPCKTEASRKAVPLDLRIVPFFRRWYEFSLFKAPEDYVFAAGSNRAGGKRGKQPISLSVVFRYHIKPVADRLGIQPAVFGWHTFRRSFASIVVGSTKDVKAAQELMRHSTSKLTLDLYAQTLPENKVAASKAIAGSLCCRSFRLVPRYKAGTAPRNLLNSMESTSPRRLARPRTSPFHGGNTGSNPVGDANPPF
jgi:integrase